MSLRAPLCLALLLILALTASCASTPPPTKSAQANFQDAETAYAAGHYEEAITLWKKVRESYSSPELTAQAELKIADAHYESKAYIEAAAAYEDFRKLHPGSDKSAYALYRLCLSHYNQIGGIDTDQTPVKNTVTTIESFLSRYPSSEYAAEMKQKLADCRAKQLAYENYVGAFYVRTGKYISGIKRLNEALQRFPGAPALDQTLFNLGKAYLQTGDLTQGKLTMRRLAAEYPTSPLNAEATKLLVTFVRYSS